MLNVKLSPLLSPSYLNRVDEWLESTSEKCTTVYSSSAESFKNMSSNTASSETERPLVPVSIASIPTAPASFATLVRDLKIRILEMVVDDDTVPRRRLPKRFWTSGRKVESHATALVALGSVNREMYELVRPFLWQGVRIGSGGRTAFPHRDSQEILRRHAQFITVLIVDDKNLLPGEIADIIETMGSLRRLEFDRTWNEGIEKSEEERLARTVAGLQDLEEVVIHGRPNAEQLQMAIDATWSSSLRRVTIDGTNPSSPLPARDDPLRISATTLFAFLAKFSDTLETVTVDYPIAPHKSSTVAPVLPPYLLRHLHHVHLGSNVDQKLSLCNTFVSRSPRLKLLSLTVNYSGEEQREENWGAMMATCKTLGITVEIGCKAVAVVV